MKHTGEGWQLRVHLRETDTWYGKPLHEALVRRLSQEDLADCRVFRGIDGSILIEAIVEEGKFRKALPVFDEMIGKGHITLQKVDLITYR